MLLLGILKDTKLRVRGISVIPLLIKETKNYGQVPGLDVLVELVEPVTADPELEEQLD